MTDHDDDDSLHELCGRCGTRGQDRRTLWMACLADLQQIGVPLASVGIRGHYVEQSGTDPRFGFPVFKELGFGREEREEPRLYPFYTMRVCKSCRGDWITMIQRWFRALRDEMSLGDRDERDDPKDTLVRLLASIERARVELIGLTQRAEELTGSTRRAAGEIGVHDLPVPPGET